VAAECAVCGVRAELEAPFSKLRRSFLRKSLPICPRCLQRRKLKELAKAERWVLSAIVVCGAAGILLPAEDLARGFLLSAAFFFVSYTPALLLHELGHAALAHALGLRLFGIVVGYGEPLWRGRVLGIPLEWRRVPSGGVTRGAVLSERGARWRMALFALGGPAANALAAALGWAALSAGASGFGAALASGWAIANTLLAVANLMPFQSTSPTGALASDGLLILHALLAKPAKVHEWLRARLMFEALMAREERGYAHALARTHEGLAAYPEDPELTSLLGICLIDTGDVESARDVFQAQLTTELTAVGRAITLNNVAWCDFVSARDERLDEALHCSQEAHAQLGWLSAVQSTRAAVLVWAERAAEGLPLILAALDDPLDPADRARATCVLALAYAQLGRRDEAKSALERARGIDAECFLLPRAAAAVG
jgi:Flp pilus assembly protein TadD